MTAVVDFIKHKIYEDLIYKMTLHLNDMGQTATKLTTTLTTELERQKATLENRERVRKNKEISTEILAACNHVLHLTGYDSLTRFVNVLFSKPVRFPYEGSRDPSDHTKLDKIKDDALLTPKDAWYALSKASVDPIEVYYDENLKVVHVFGSNRESLRTSSPFFLMNGDFLYNYAVVFWVAKKPKSGPLKMGSTFTKGEPSFWKKYKYKLYDLNPYDPLNE